MREICWLYLVNINLEKSFTFFNLTNFFRNNLFRKKILFYIDVHGCREGRKKRDKKEFGIVGCNSNFLDV